MYVHRTYVASLLRTLYVCCNIYIVEYACKSLCVGSLVLNAISPCACIQVGTEEEPFMHKATITLHGTVNDPEIPIYGAKVLAVRQGQLDLHGLPRAVTWTRLASTAERNGTVLHLQVNLHLSDLHIASV